MEPNRTADPCDAMEQAVRLLIRGDRLGAEAALGSIDRTALIRERKEFKDRARISIKAVGGGGQFRTKVKREPVRAADQTATFARDRYTCRYRHCGRRTLDLRVLKLLSAAFSDALPYHPNWKPVEDHIVYWVLSTSLEHIVSFPEGGTSAASNLVTACYLCNDTKNSYPMDVLGWELADPGTLEWRGLTEYLPELRRAVPGE